MDNNIRLPDYERPPLEEVVIGVQFVTPEKYNSILSKDIWSLFKSEYPFVKEQPPLEPLFETFGGNTPQPGFKFHIGPPPVRSRYWFNSSDDNHLIQFQEDRFLLNWKKLNGKEYPRFENIAMSFEDNLKLLQSYFDSTLDINQAEVSYINIIPVENYSDIGKIISLIEFDHIEMEGLSLNIPEVIKDVEGKPYARLIHEFQSIGSNDGKHKAFKLSLTFRGKPHGNELKNAMEFISEGHTKIVQRFSSLCTNYADKIWGKMK